ncbi:MAG: bifunctional alpha,alpha-trehalose-phosphate synthase (UDP-forming)/trehalose-phosphatase [Bacteroidia bacterium]|nr:bifunctional alpha,alpha-trehalose-phosphate synthase (UDP-forming)/trehalose-phosphatase [Bacteroidia bacterium]
MGRLVIISNRLPLTIEKVDDGYIYHPSSGGLATGLASLDDSLEKIWIGWPGPILEEGDQQQIIADLNQKGLVPVFLSAQEIELYYEGFSNKTIWPHFHYFTQYTSYEEKYWEAYQSVNSKVFKIVKDQIRPGDTIWVHDYQLMLLPNLVREQFPDAKIVFFLHIPFPSFEIFRVLPYRKKLLEGVLGADLIGLHTFGYMRHFLSAVYRILGHEATFGEIDYANRRVNVDVFPMGIDYDKFANPEQYYAEDRIGLMDERRFKSKGRKIIISIDRLDYTKGISQRLKAFERFIHTYPQYRGKLTLILLVVPSRSNVDQYQELKQEIDTLVGQIDGDYRTFGWSPVQYFFRSFSFEDLTKLYKVADVAMITPYRDGMNLVAKEFVASKDRQQKGVLILSEMAGAATELSDALLVNPLDINDLVDSLKQALEMSEAEQSERLKRMQDRIRKYTVSKWARNFIESVNSRRNLSTKSDASISIHNAKDEIASGYRAATKRTIILDYDGTLMPFNEDPQAVFPDTELLSIIEALATDKKNKIVINSGRDRNTLDEWLGHLNVDIAAEHGTWIRIKGKWQLTIELDDSWKTQLQPILNKVVDRTPGSFVEEKDYSLAWHYRNSDRELGQNRQEELKVLLTPHTQKLGLQILEGKKVLEIKNWKINKGKVLDYWLNGTKLNFFLAIGDDATDEDMFKVLPPEALTFKVGQGLTSAGYRLENYQEVRSLLKHLSNIGENL